MNPKRWLSTLLLLSLLSPVATLAQEDRGAPEALTPAAKQKEEEKEEARRELEKKALAMLDEVIGDAQNLRVAENRVRLLAGAADLLWPRDEKRARALFRDAALAINEANGRAEKNEERRNRRNWAGYAMRQEFLRTVARRDAQLALDLLYATRQQPAPAVPEGAPRNYQTPDPELRLEQSLAMQVAENDPKRALQIAEESLAKGISFEVLTALGRLQTKDAEAAAKLARSIVNRLRAENLATNPEAMQVAFHLIRMGTGAQTPFIFARAVAFDGDMGAQTVASESGGRGGSKPLTLDTQTMRDLVDILVTGALDSRARHLAGMIEPLMSEVEKYAPERAPLVRRRLEESRRTLDPESRRWSEYNHLFESNSAEAVIEAAAKAPPDVRNSLYTHAAMIAAGKGDVERARQIVNDQLRDSPERAQLIAHLDRLALLNSIKQGKIEDARKLVAQIRPVEERAASLARLAMAVIAAKGERKVALELLNEAQQLIRGRIRSSAQINAQLQLARVYALADPPRAFEIVEAVIDRANEMIAAADVLDGFMGRGEFFRDGELVMSYGIASLETIYMSYGRELAALARADFDHARAAAAKFQRVEVRTMAKLLIAQGLLSDRQPSENFNDGLLAGGGVVGEGE